MRSSRRRTGGDETTPRCARGRIVGIILVACFALAGVAHAGQQPRFCSDTARTLSAACRAGVTDDTLVKEAAGAHGAWFNAVSLQRAWPASRFDVLADAGNGVITAAFLAGPFGNWEFTRNLPDDIPGVRESIENGTGIIGYTEGG